MQAGEFADVADVLGGEGPFPEGRRRTAVSRYYYAAFHDARDQLLARGVWRKAPTGPASHESVIRAYAFAEAGARTTRKIGEWLRDLRSLRTAADYDLAAPDDPGVVADARGLAGRIRDALPAVDYAQCFRDTALAPWETGPQRPPTG